ncbi:MAG: hypothetical protein IJM38_03865 [Ruminococcus sp.]|nr:hypothetical protein [Ruminococcus sp.]
MKHSKLKRFISGCTALAMLAGMQPLTAILNFNTVSAYAEGEEQESLEYQGTVVTSASTLFDLNGGSIENENFVTIDGVCSLADESKPDYIPDPTAPARSNLVFAGWVNSDNEPVTEFQADTKYFANWKYGSREEVNEFSNLKYQIYSSEHYFDLKGSGNFRTTYNNNGYELYYKYTYGPDNLSASGMLYFDGSKATYSIGNGVYITPVFSFSNSKGEISENELENTFMKIEYLVQNRGENEITELGISSTADVMIGGNDSAAIYGYSIDQVRVTNENKDQFSTVPNVEMHDGSGNIFSLSLSDDGDCWWGYYSARDDYAFSGHKNSVYDGSYDSGIAYSWQGISLDSGETVTRNAVFAAGDIHLFRKHSFNENGFCFGGDDCDLLIDHVTEDTFFCQPAIYVSDKYEIRNFGQLMWLTEQINSGSINANANVQLMHDINMPEDARINWTPIKNYSGEFNGNGYEISGIKFTSADAEHNGGIFEKLSGARIHDLGIVDSQFSSQYGATGSLAGSADSNTTIDNVYSLADLSGDNTAGLVYSIDSSKITDSFFAGTIDNDNKIFGVSTGTVSNSYCLSDETGTTSFTSDDFASGKAAYKLGSGWFQNLGTDSFPKLRGEDVVYTFTVNHSCSETDPQPETKYTNDAEKSGTVELVEHVFDDWGRCVVPATCTENEFWNKRCINCGKESAETFERDEEGHRATGHSYADNGYCIKCNHFDPDMVVTTTTTTSTTTTSTTTTTTTTSTTSTSTSTTTTTTTTSTTSTTSTTTTTTTTRAPFAPVTTENDPDVEEKIEKEKNNKLNITGELTAKPMTKSEIQSVGIDVDDPDNYHYFNYSVELTFHDEPIIFTKYEAIPINISTSEPGTIVAPQPKISYPNHDYVGPGDCVYIPEIEATVTYYEWEEQEMFIIIYGECKWLKEFYDVQLIVMNSDRETLEDCTATLNVPEGLTLCNSEQTQSVGDLLPLEVKNIHWYLRGDVAGDYNVSALFKGTNDGDEFEYEFHSKNDIHVYAGNALKMTIEAPNYSCLGYDYPIRITLTNVSDRPIYGLEHTVKAQQGTYTYKHIASNGERVCIKETETFDPKNGGNTGGGKTISVDTLNPGESAVIDIKVHDAWKSPLQKELETNKIFIDLIALGAGAAKMPIANFLATLTSKIIEGITVIHVLDSVCVTTLEGSTTEIPYQIIISDNFDEIGEGKEFDFVDAGVYASFSALGALPEGTIPEGTDIEKIIQGAQPIYFAGKWYFSELEFTSDFSKRMTDDYEKVKSGEMTEDEFNYKYNTEYLEHIFSPSSNGDIFNAYTLTLDSNENPWTSYLNGTTLTVADDIIKRFQTEDATVTYDAYITDANGNKFYYTPSSSPAPRMNLMRKVWASPEPDFVFEVLTGDYEYNNGVYTLKDNCLIRTRANKPGVYYVHFVNDEGNETVYPFIAVPEHECTGGHFYVANAPEGGNDGLAVQLCTECKKPVKTRRIPASFYAMLSDGQMFQNVYQAAEYAKENYDGEIELSIFGDITLGKDLVIPDNVKLLITPFANITFKNSAHIIVDGEYIDFTHDNEDEIYENVVLEYWDGRTEIMPVKYGEEVTELPDLSGDCEFNGWYADAEFSEPFVPFTAGDKNHSKIYYADIHHTFTASGKCSKCGELKNGKDAFQKIGISVSSEIKIKYVVRFTEKALADSELRVVFEMADGSTQTQKITDAIDNGDGTYTFTCSVYIHEINENIRAQVYYSNNEKGSYLDYSVKKYTDYIIANANSFSEATVNSIKALVNFSGYVQIYAGTAPEDAVNADLGMPLDDVDPEISDDFNAVKTVNSSAVTIKSASLSVDTLSKINIRFELANGVNLSDYVFTVNGQTVTPKKSGTSYIVSMNGISPENFDKMYNFKVQSKKNTSDYVSIDYSCLTYAKKVLEISDDAILKNTMKALYFCNQEIKKYITE